MKNIIELGDSLITAIAKMAEGNPGAIRVMTELVKKGEHGLIAIIHLDDMQIRGWKIWYGFKDYCNENLDKFYECIMNRDKEIINFINKYQ